MGQLNQAVTEECYNQPTKATSSQNRKNNDAISSHYIEQQNVVMTIQPEPQTEHLSQKPQNQPKQTMIPANDPATFIRTKRKRFHRSLMPNMEAPYIIDSTITSIGHHDRNDRSKMRNTSEEIGTNSMTMSSPSTTADYQQHHPKLSSTYSLLLHSSQQHIQSPSLSQHHRYLSPEYKSDQFVVASSSSSVSQSQHSKDDRITAHAASDSKFTKNISDHHDSQLPFSIHHNNRGEDKTYASLSSSMITTSAATLNPSTVSGQSMSVLQRSNSKSSDDSELAVFLDDVDL
jgi:hypothetical protein